MAEFVPPDFDVPLGLETSEFVLEPLGPEHNELDYEAWTSSKEHIAVTRKRSHPATIAYIERRLAEGKTRRDANRCLKRYLARNLYRLLEHQTPMPT